MHVLWLTNLMTNLNRLDPGVRYHIFDRGPVFGIRFKHLADERPARAWIEKVDRRGARRDGRIGVSTCSSIGLVQWVRCLRRAPRQFLEV